MIRYIAKWFGLMILEVFLEFGVFSPMRWDILFFLMLPLFYLTGLFGFWGLVAKIGGRVATKALAKGVRAVVRETRSSKQDLATELCAMLEHSNNKRADLNAYLKRNPSVPIKFR